MEKKMKNFYSVGNSVSEKEKHIEYAKNAKNCIVEIGVLNGDTSKIFCECNDSASIYGVDPIIPDSMDAGMLGNIEKIKSIEKNYPNYHFINDFSFNVVKNWNTLIDYLFIDGDHNYEAVKNDFNSWYPFVAQGGVIAFHDSACNRAGPHWWPGPSRLADELLQDPRLEYLETVYTITFFKKI